jgi:hypothetical protein
LSLEAVQSWAEKCSQGRSKVADNAWQGAEAAETTRNTSKLCVSKHR